MVWIIEMTASICLPDGTPNYYLLQNWQKHDGGSIPPTNHLLLLLEMNLASSKVECSILISFAINFRIKGNLDTKVLIQTDELSCAPCKEVFIDIHIILTNIQLDLWAD